MLKRPFSRVGYGLTLSFAVLSVLGCKRERSDAPPPDPLTPPQQSAPAATEIAPVTQQTDTPPATSAPPPPKDTKSGSGSGTGSGSGSGSGSKKEDDKKEDDKKEDDKKEDEKKEDKSCVTRCQSAFTTCMTPKMPGSGGFPQPPDPEACRKSLEGCQSACQ